MNTISRMLAWRYVTKSAYDSTISIMVIISFLGIFVGSFSLALVTAIMHGFDIETQKKMQGTHAQATIHAYGDPIHLEALAPILTTEFPDIFSFAPSTTTHALLQAENEEAPSPIILKAVDPDKEVFVTTLSEKTDVRLQKLSGTAIIIGQRLADDAGISVGDTVSILYADKTRHQGRTIRFKTYDVSVLGFIKTGIDDFDSTIVLCSFELLERLFPDIGIKEINLKLSPDAHEQDTFSHIKERFDLGVYSWKERYPAIISALKLEKYVCFIVLALISLVASINIIALIFMIITNKRSDIAILRALGALETDITNIFLLLGIIITVTATILGLICATGVSWFLEFYPFIQLPDVYYVSHLPARMSWYIPCLVLTLSITTCTLAILIPIRKIKSLSIASILRFEG